MSLAKEIEHGIRLALKRNCSRSVAFSAGEVDRITEEQVDDILEPAYPTSSSVYDGLIDDAILHGLKG